MLKPHGGLIDYRAGVAPVDRHTNLVQQVRTKLQSRERGLVPAQSFAPNPDLPFCGQRGAQHVARAAKSYDVALS